MTFSQARFIGFCTCFSIPVQNVFDFVVEKMKNGTMKMCCVVSVSIHKCSNSFYIEKLHHHLLPHFAQFAKANLSRESKDKLRETAIQYLSQFEILNFQSEKMKKMEKVRRIVGLWFSKMIYREMECHNLLRREENWELKGERVQFNNSKYPAYRTVIVLSHYVFLS